MIPVLAMGLFKNWKLIAGGALLLAFLTLVGVSYFHYTGLLSSVESLAVKNSQLETKVGMQKEEILAHERAIDKWVEAQKELQERLQKLQLVAENATKESRRLNEIFSKHDLGNLAKKKPGLIQSRLNAGTANLFRMFKCETGRDYPCKDNTPSHPNTAP